MILTKEERARFATVLRSIYNNEQYHHQDFGYISYSLGKLRVTYNVYFDELEFTIKTGFWRTFWNPFSGDLRMSDDGPWWDQARKLLNNLENREVIAKNEADAREQKRKADLNKDWNR